MDYIPHPKLGSSKNRKSIIRKKISFSYTYKIIFISSIKDSFPLTIYIHGTWILNFYVLAGFPITFTFTNPSLEDAKLFGYCPGYVSYNQSMFHNCNSIFIINITGVMHTG